MKSRASVAGFTLFVGSLTFLALTAGKFPSYRYIPLEHRWSWSLPGGVIGMDWYFRATVSFTLAAIAFGASHWLVARIEALRSSSAARAFLGLGFAALFWAAAYMALVLIITPR